MTFLYFYGQEPSTSAKANSFRLKSGSGQETSGLGNGAAGDSLGMPAEDRAALRIQTAFRAYRVYLTKTIRDNSYILCSDLIQPLQLTVNCA